MKELEGKIALVTGASRGLGRGVAAVLAEKGAELIVNYRTDSAHAESLCKEITEQGGKAVPFRADVGKKEEVDRLFEFVRSQFGRLDILVNNAGTTRAQDIFETSEADWDFILQTNLKSVFLMCKSAMELMREQNSGRIINMSSIVAYRGALFGHVHYAATKAGILGVTRTLARTGAPYHITVNALAPGIIETELLFQTHGAEGVAKLAKTVPLGLGKVRDVGLAAAFLAGEGGRYLTGICLDINGGMNFHCPPFSADPSASLSPCGWIRSSHLSCGAPFPGTPDPPQETEISADPPSSFSSADCVLPHSGSSVNRAFSILFSLLSKSFRKPLFPVF